MGCSWSPPPFSVDLDRLLRALPAKSLTSLVLENDFHKESVITGVSRLTALQRLSLGGYVDSVAPLTQLTHLQIYPEALDPASQICGLSRLQHLYIKGFSYLPPPFEWSALYGPTFLRVYGLAKAPGGCIPDFASLPNLRHLILPDCGATQLHPDLCSSPWLTALDMPRNLGLGSSGEFRLPPKLASLVLGECGLSSLPPSVASSDTLTYLNVANNQGIVFPGSLRLGSLQHLVLSSGSYAVGCGLRQLPLEVSSLTALTCLDVSGNVGLSLNAPLLAPLRRLRVLDLERTGLRAVPEGISCLASLTRLNISGDHCVSETADLMGLQHLCGMPCLYVLDLGSRHLGELPQGLHALVELNLRDAEFSQAQGSLAGLPSLQRVCMGGCFAERGLPKGIRDLPNLRELVVPGGGHWPQQDAQWLQDVFGSDGSEFQYEEYVSLHSIV
jgi:Leucine-rich repeat (LRR) protein